jgi:predicted amidohydrolase
MKVGYIQTSPIFAEKEQNFENIDLIISKKEADILVLPELFATGYTFSSRKEVAMLAEGKEGKTVDFLKALAKKTKALIIGGYIEEFDEKIYNSAMIVSKKGVLGNYRKIHLYYKEKLWFEYGDTPLKVFKFKDFTLGVMICFDWYFPETARSLALLGADIIAHPSNLVLPYCQDAMVTRCLENKVYAITSNRVGGESRGEDSFKFTGKSQITSYNGEILSSAPRDDVFVDIVEIELEKVRDKSINIYNDIFEDRKVEFYRNK